MLPDFLSARALPDLLLRTGPKGLLVWQWGALVALLPGFWAVGRFLGWATRRGLTRLATRTKTEWDDKLLARIRGPLALAWALAAFLLLAPLLGVSGAGQAFLAQVVKAGGLVTVFWALVRAVGVVGEVLSVSHWAKTSPAAPSLLSLGVRGGEVGIVALGAVAALSALGFPVASLLAGLGIGGLAFALAAQKTVENLFGSVSLGVDQPLRVGDFVKVGEVQGTVETIGLRSTRIRSLDRTLVTIPNGKLADREIETFAARDRIRLHQVVGLAYGVTSHQMRRVLSGFDAALRAQPKLWPDAHAVSLKEMSANAVNVEVTAWFETTDLLEFALIRQEVLLALMDVVEREGARFASATPTIVVAPRPPLPPLADPEADTIGGA